MTTATVLDDVTKTWLRYLHRGGQYAYWWTAQNKRSIWWKVDAPDPVPNGDTDHYVGVHPTGALPDNPTQARAKIATVAAVNCLFSEYDGKDFADGKTGALAHVRTLTPAPTVVIDSGGGYHCYWLLREPFLLATDEDRERARKAQAAWVGYTKGDNAAKDLARILRIPGTRNYKYDPSRPVTIIDADFQRLYALADLEAAADPGTLRVREPITLAAKPTITLRTADDDSPLDNGATPARLLDMALGRVGTHGRNATGLWLANQLRDNGYSIDEAAPIMLDFQRAVTRQGDHAYPEAEAKKTLQSSYAGAKREPWQSDRLRFSGHRQDAAVFRRGKLAYAITPQDDGYSIKATSGRYAETVHLAGDLANITELATALAAALPVTADDVRADLQELPAAIAAHPDPAKAPAPEAETLADFAPWVNGKLNKRPGRAAKQAISATITGWLLQRGRLLHDSTQRPYLLTEDHHALPIDEDGITLRAYLTSCGLNPTEETFAWLRADLEVIAHRDGQKTTLARWAVIDADGFLCIACGPTQYVRATANELALHVNGDRGVVFAGDAVLPAWDYTAAPIDPLTLPAFLPPLVAPHEVPGYTDDAQRHLLAAWLTALVANLRPLPIVALIGSKGGGKSTLARATVRLLLGADANITDLSQDAKDFWAAVTNNAAVGFDNIDAEPPTWFPDGLAVLATGGQRKVRKYYTTNQEVSLPIVAACLVTTRTASFARPDVAERLLPIFTGELADTGRLADSELERDALLARDGCLAYLARQAAALIDARVNAPKGLPARFLDFAEMTWAWHRVNAHEGTIYPTLTAWRAAQFLSIGDADPLLAAILECAPSDGVRPPGIPRSTPADFLRILNSRNAGLPFQSGKLIKRRLIELRSSLALAGWRLDIDDVGGRTFVSIDPHRQ